MGDPACYVEVRTPDGDAEPIKRYVQPVEEASVADFDYNRYVEHDAPKVTVVVVANDDTSNVVECLVRIRGTTQNWHGDKLELMVVDNGCDEQTRRVLDVMANLYSVRLRLDEYHGWLPALVAAFDEASGEVVVVVDPNVYVQDGWLERLVNTAVNAGFACPLCTKQVPPLDGMSIREMARRVATIEPITAAMSCPNDQCFAVTKDAFDKAGGWDLKFSPGHGALLDLVARIVDAGFDTWYANDVLVHDRSHGPVADPVGKHVSAQLIKKHGKKKVEALFYDITSPALDVVANACMVEPSGKPRVVFSFNEVVICGASLLVTNVCNQLIHRGWEAGIVCTRFDIGHQRMMPMEFAPLVFNSRAAQVEYLADLSAGSVVVAPLCATTEMVADALDANQDLHGIYYVQDDEARFKSSGKGKEFMFERAQVEGSYFAIPNLLANSQWVAQLVSKVVGKPVPMICPGVDQFEFRPGDRAHIRVGVEPVRILAHSRPSTPRRGWEFIEATMRRVLQHRRVEFYTYDEDPGFNHPSHCHLGRLPPKRLANLMRRCDIFIEGSEVQGFGMQALEAMASGLALVCTDNYGIQTFGSSGYDCVIVPVGDAERTASIVCKLVDEPETRKVLGDNAIRTARRFSWDQIGGAWDEYIRGLLG